MKVSCSGESGECLNSNNEPVPATEVIALVTDSCPECEENQIILSPDAWNDFSESTDQALCGSWEFIDCPCSYLEGESMKIKVKAGGNLWWQALQPINHRSKVTDIEMEIPEIGLMSLQLFGDIGKDGFWWENQINEGQLGFPTTVKVTTEAGVCMSGTLIDETDLEGGTIIELVDSCSDTSQEG